MAPPDWTARAPGAPPVRIPKLSYRNPLPADQSSITSHTSQSTSSSDAASTEPFPDFQPSIASPLRPSFDTQSFISPSLASNASNSSSRSSTSSKKRKTNGMLGFLTLKEPSQSALEQFAEQQRKQGAGKGATLTAVGVVSVTPKLPASVPKVNSKWDGIPESIKARDSSSRKRSSTSTSTTTTSRISTVRSTPSVFSFASELSHGPPNTLASASSSVSDFSIGPCSATDERSGAGSPTVDTSVAKHATSSPSPLHELTCFFPEDTLSSVSLPVSPLEPSFGSPADNKPPPPALTLSQPPSHKRLAALATPPASPLHATAHTRAKSDKISFRGFLAGEAQEINLPDSEDEDDEAITRANLEFLYEMQRTATSSPLPSPTIEGPPTPKSTTNFSRPRPHQPVNLVPDFSHLSLSATTPRRSGFGGLPTLYEASIISNENDTIAELPEFGDRAPGDSHAKDSDAVSIASSITPSEMSASWYQSSRERLGLGGRIRKDGSLPWERGELQPELERGFPVAPTT
ncbi:hypothetical protein K491DRAFT_686209 [Lophiostoma macrostomum CBS 122681]|uniref:Uncharacterized protein n=1 Tax=Lophiostoma macrostomum CBS 122681 TaxID=1314788 RepID=A0A6A6TTA2_9PLEO|nr:hypothetical protein K491DRAFT_686209 [Lophiostoma macrostomum CBS 122681]